MIRHCVFLLSLFCTIATVHAQSWRYTGSMNVVRHEPILLPLQNDLVMAIGGLGSNERALNSCEFYDVASESWSMAPSIETPGNVRIDLAAPDGRSIETLIEGRYPAGIHRQAIDAGHLPNGIYFIRMRSGRGSSVAKLMVLR